MNGCLGEDEDVVLMDALFNLDHHTIENKNTERTYPLKYLVECREKLISKVKKYRVVMEDQKSQIILLQCNKNTVKKS